MYGQMFLCSQHCAFSGEYGMGIMANELSLGCDCLGKIHYLVCFSLLVMSFIV